jgi:hypothetical protein
MASACFSAFVNDIAPTPLAREIVYILQLRYIFSRYSFRDERITSG